MKSTNKKISIVKSLIIASGISSAGSGLFLSVALVYFVTKIGLPTVQIGIILSAGSFIGLLFTVIIGRVADCVSTRKTLIAILLLRAVAYGCLIFVNGIISYSVFMIVAIIGDNATPGLQQALIGLLLGQEQRNSAMSTILAAKNIGFTTGLIVGGVILSTNSDMIYRSVFIINAISFVVLAVIISRFHSNSEFENLSKPPESTRLVYKSPLRSISFLGLIVSNALLLLHDPVLKVLLPVWVVSQTSLHVTMVAVLTGINTVLTIACQLLVPRTKFSRKWTKVLSFAIIALVCMCFTFAFAQSLHNVIVVAVIAILAIIAHSIGENLHTIAVWDLSFQMAPPDQLSEYLGAFHLSKGLKSIIGSVLVMGVVLPSGLMGWTFLALLFTIGYYGTFRFGQITINEAKKMEVGLEL